MPKTIRILCVDDHEIVLEGISLILGLQPDMEVVGQAATVRESIEQFGQHRPDVTLMDLRFAAGNGIAAIRSIVHDFPSARIIALSMYQSVEATRKALKAGAITYLSKNTPSDKLLWTIREVHGGRQPLPSGFPIKHEQSSPETLTPREIEVIALVSQGLRNKEIAGFLHITEETVEAHLRHMFAKMRVSDRTGAVRAAVQRGIIDLM